jgi:bacterioferritin-associated ferredoxin
VFICICHLVTRTEIEALIESGVRSVDQISAKSSAGTDCGKCQRNIGRILEAFQRDLDTNWGGSHAGQPANH